MAWISTDEIPEGDRARSDSSPRTTLNRAFNVRVSPGDSSEVARLGTNVPRRNDPHPDNASAVCTGVSVRHPNAKSFPDMYLVIAEYSTRIDGPAPSEDDESDPLNKPIEVIYGLQTTSEPLEFAYGFESERDAVFPIVNSAFVPYDPVPTREAGTRILTVRKNIASFDPQTLDNGLLYHVNSLPWNGFAPERVLFTGVTAATQRAGTTTYWAATYTFKLQFDDPFAGFTGWITAMMDRGKHQIADDGKLIPLTDKNGDELLVDVPLDGNGDILTLDPLSPPSSQVTYNIWHTYPRANFTPLGITLV